MCKLLLGIVLLGAAAQNLCAGPYYDLSLTASSAAMRVGGIIYVADKTHPYVPTITMNGTGGAVTATSYYGDGSYLTGIIGQTGSTGSTGSTGATGSS